MTIFVESLKRLYLKGKITEAKVDELLLQNKITQEDKNYILTKEV